MFLLLAAGTLFVWLDEFHLLLPLYHQLFVDLEDDAGGGSPVVALNVAFHISRSVCRRIYSNPYCLPRLQYLLSCSYSCIITQ